MVEGKDGLLVLLLSLHLEYAVKYASRKVQENHKDLGLNGTHQLLDYTNNFNFLNDNTNTIKTEGVLDA
jgi:hypothetical protein